VVGSSFRAFSSLLCEVLYSLNSELIPYPCYLKELYKIKFLFTAEKNPSHPSCNCFDMVSNRMTALPEDKTLNFKT